MKRSLLFGLVGFVLVAGALGLSALPSAQSAASVEEAPAPTPLFPTQELAELDRSVQAFFRVVPDDGSFGFSRIPTFKPRHAAYNPHSTQDRAVVSKLRGAKQDVLFLLVGREKFASRSLMRKRVQGPILITSPFTSAVVSDKEAFKQAQIEAGAVMKSAPKGPGLVTVADEVFANAQPEKGARTQMGNWKVIACPIEASSPQCVTCHNNMAHAATVNNGSTVPTDNPDIVSLHDPLGVALYCYRPKVESSSQTRAPQQTSAR